MQKIMIMDKTLKELGNKSEAELFGQQVNETIIISSLNQKMGLKKVGVFHCKPEPANALQAKGSLFFFLNGEQLKCDTLNKEGTAESLDVETINYETNFDDRIKGIVDKSVLQEKTVTIIGLGSGGSETAVEQVRSGVTNLILADHDIVSISNICRSIYDLSDIGKLKTQALYEKLLRINPNINVQLYDEAFTKMSYQKQMEIINASDLIIEATDDITCKLLVNGLAHNIVPVIYPAVYAGGSGGDILLTLPGLPCFECVFHSIMEEMKNLKKGEMDYQLGKPKSVPGLVADIHVIVSRSVKLALGVLLAEQDNTLIDKITEDGCTLLIITNERGVYDFKQPLNEIWTETSINPTCFCQTLG